jgi:hypothetical protein
MKCNICGYECDDPYDMDNHYTLHEINEDNYDIEFYGVDQ